MNYIYKIFLHFLIVGIFFGVGRLSAQATVPEWQSQYAIGKNKLRPHTYVWPYDKATNIRQGDYENSRYYMSLNGRWKFSWVKNPDNRPKDFYKPGYYTGGWADIKVPGNWERQGYGTAIYVNESYEFDDPLFNFKKNPPLVPYDENEVGSYRRSFTLPLDWKDRRTVIYNPQIQISAESETKRSIFREKDKTKRSKKESAQHSKSRNKSFVMTSVSAL